MTIQEIKFKWEGQGKALSAAEIDFLLIEHTSLPADLAEKKAECERLKSDFAYVEKCFKCTEGCLLAEKNAEVTRLESLAASRLADQDSYRAAVEDALVVANIGVASGDAKADLHKLICWEIDVAIDPRVSKRAADLIRLADHGAVERHVTRRVAMEIVRYLRKEWSFMGAGAVSDIRKKYGVE